MSTTVLLLLLLLVIAAMNLASSKRLRTEADRLDERRQMRDDRRGTP